MSQSVTDFVQYLTFVLNDEIFALPIDRVQEVLDSATITRIPRTAPYLRGVINLRGNVVPILDLKQKLAIGRTDTTGVCCVIVVGVFFEGDMIELGVLADAVQEVYDLSADKVEPPPSIGTTIETSYISGMGKRNEEFIIILDIDAVLSGRKKEATPVSREKPKAAKAAETQKSRPPSHDDEDEEENVLG